MEFEKLDQNLRSIFQGVSLKEPPKTMLDHFEDEVMNKVRFAAWSPVISFLGVGILMAGLILGAMFYFPKQTVKSYEIKEVSAPGVQSENGVKQAQEVLSDLQIEQISEEVSTDLLLLQMLGEDEEFNMDFKLMDSDMEILSQAATPQI